MSPRLKQSQENPEEHSEIKVLLLKKYMEAYINILAKSTFIKGVVLHDLFCGPGKYSNGKLGSPLIFLSEIMQALNGESNRFLNHTEFECYFNDNNENKVQHLEKEVESIEELSKLPIRITITNEDYQNILPNVVSQYSELSSKRAFAFIDPYGYKDISVEDIANLLESGKSEVLLFLPTQFMYRFSENGTPEKLSKFIEGLGIEFDNKESGISFIEKVKEGFRNFLGSQHFVDSFIIERGKNQFFALFFFTSHILGFEKMLDAKWYIDDREGRGWQPGTEQDLFSVINDQPEIRPLEDRLREFLGKQPKSNAEVYEFTLRSGFLPKHAKIALDSMNLKVEGNSSKKVRKGSYYLNYKDWKSNPNKIYIKLN